MGRLHHIDIEVVVEEDGATDGGYANGFTLNAEKIDGLGNQAVGDPMVTARAEMEGDVFQAFGPLERLSHENQAFGRFSLCFHGFFALAVSSG